MRIPDEQIVTQTATPIFVKTSDDMPWPDDLSVFYLLSRNGLFLCRNHEFFQSCVPARTGPGELAEQATSLEARYPEIPQIGFEQIIGFFSHVADLHGSEAAVLLVWNRTKQAMEIHVPNQKATVSENFWGQRFALEVEYDMPFDLPPDVFVIGDVHSHVHSAAYASATDVKDEIHRPGIHLVVGRIHMEPPELHCEIVVDGTRFDVDAQEMLAGYDSRNEDFPMEWLDRLQVEVFPSSYGRSTRARTWGNGAASAHARDGKSS